jgi:hypothetical protein
MRATRALTKARPIWRIVDKNDVFLYLIFRKFLTLLRFNGTRTAGETEPKGFAEQHEEAVLSTGAAPLSSTSGHVKPVGFRTTLSKEPLNLVRTWVARS